MSYKIDYLREDTLIIVSVEGVLLTDRFVETIKEVVDGKDYPPNINAVYDLTHMSFDNITSDYLQLMSNQAREFGH